MDGPAPLGAQAEVSLRAGVTDAPLSASMFVPDSDLDCGLSRFPLDPEDAENDRVGLWDLLDNNLPTNTYILRLLMLSSSGSKDVGAAWPFDKGWPGSPGSADGWHSFLSLRREPRSGR